MSVLKILFVILLITLVIYGVTRAIERRGIAPTPKRQPPPRQVAPDDDPDFLWDIERRRRHQAKNPKPGPKKPGPEKPGPEKPGPEAGPARPASYQSSEPGDSEADGTT